MRLPRMLPGALAGLTATGAALVAGSGPVAGAPLPAAPTPASAAVRADTPVGGPRLAQPGVVSDARAGVPAPPRVQAQSFVVADAATGRVLAAKNAHEKLYPASTLKTLAAITVFPTLDAKQVYRALPEDANIEGSKAGMVPGGTYTVDQLFDALFIRSGNDATTALARVAGGPGGVERTLEQMREKSRSLGALDTTVVNPTGLDEDGQHSSAYDLALFGRAALQTPGLRPYMGRTHALFPGKMPVDKEPRPTFEMWTQQKFVLNYDGGIGVKNGYTTKGRFTLIAAAERDGRTVLVTLMKTHPGAWQEAAALTDWAFEHGGAVEPVGELVEEATPPPPAGFQAVTPVSDPRNGVVAAPASPTGADGTPLPLLLVAGAALTLTVGALRGQLLLRDRAVRRSPTDSGELGPDEGADEASPHPR